MPSNAAFASASPDRPPGGRARLGRCLIVLAAAAATVSIVGVGNAIAASSHDGDGQPDFGPNVVIFDPSMPTSQIQATVDSIANQQVPNQFGTQRYALLFKPGTYGTAAAPLNFQVGYYTAVAGLGSSPDDVVINGSVNVYNQCAGGSCIALNNFWRSLSNLTINVTNPSFGCHTGEFWAVSQAAPMRRVHVNGLHHPHGLLHGSVVCERRLHRRLEVRRQHRDQRLAAAVARQEQQPRRLDERRLEPGVLGRRRCAGPVLPGSAVVVRWPVHHACDQPRHTGRAVPVRGLSRALRRLRARGTAELGGRVMGHRADRRLVDPDR